jgi:AGZA family xanthine/uracil permease-like MFS transporter
LAALTVCIIERRFLQAALWAASGAALSALGLMHSYRWVFGDTVLHLAPAWPWALGYLMVGVVLLAARWVTVPDDAAH